MREMVLATGGLVGSMLVVRRDELRNELFAGLIIDLDTAGPGPGEHCLWVDDDLVRNDACSLEESEALLRAAAPFFETVGQLGGVGINLAETRERLCRVPGDNGGLRRRLTVESRQSNSPSLVVWQLPVEGESGSRFKAQPGSLNSKVRE